MSDPVHQFSQRMWVTAWERLAVSELEPGEGQRAVISCHHDKQARYDAVAREEIRFPLVM